MPAFLHGLLHLFHQPLFSHHSQVLLLDEITVDMDVVGRLDLLHFFRQECEERGATIIYVRRPAALLMHVLELHCTIAVVLACCEEQGATILYVSVSCCAWAGWKTQTRWIHDEQTAADHSVRLLWLACISGLHAHCPTVWPLIHSSSLAGHPHF